MSESATIQRSLYKPLAIILVVTGLVGFICAYIITDDKMQLLANPHFRPHCNLNPIISCGSVMQSKQSSAFGFSNPFIGLAAFPMLATIGVAMLAGGRFQHWFWRGVLAVSVFGVGFVHWLFFESVYRIQALCPYCIVVWVTTITVFWYVLLYCIEQHFIPSPARLSAALRFMRRHHLDILILWLLIIAVLILQHFWYYFGQYLP